MKRHEFMKIIVPIVLVMQLDSWWAPLILWFDSSTVVLDLLFKRPYDKSSSHMQIWNFVDSLIHSLNVGDVIVNQILIYRYEVQSLRSHQSLLSAYPLIRLSLSWLSPQIYSSNIYQWQPAQFLTYLLSRSTSTDCLIQKPYTEQTPASLLSQVVGSYYCTPLKAISSIGYTGSPRFMSRSTIFCICITPSNAKTVKIYHLPRSRNKSYLASLIPLFMLSHLTAILEYRSLAFFSSPLPSPSLNSVWGTHQDTQRRRWPAFPYDRIVVSNHRRYWPSSFDHYSGEFLISQHIALAHCKYPSFRSSEIVSSYHLRIVKSDRPSYVSTFHAVTKTLTCNLPVLVLWYQASVVRYELYLVSIYIHTPFRGNIDHLPRYEVNF